MCAKRSRRALLSPRTAPGGPTRPRSPQKVKRKPNLIGPSGPLIAHIGLLIYRPLPAVSRISLPSSHTCAQKPHRNTQISRGPGQVESNLPRCSSPRGDSSEPYKIARQRFLVVAQQLCVLYLCRPRELLPSLQSNGAVKVALRNHGRDSHGLRFGHVVLTTTIMQASNPNPHHRNLSQTSP